MKYKVNVPIRANIRVDVEADDEESAYGKATSFVMDCGLFIDYDRTGNEDCTIKRVEEEPCFDMHSQTDVERIE